MKKSDVYDIIEEKKISLWKLYVESEAQADPRMKAKNDGSSYSGMDFIKYIPDETDQTEQNKKRGHWWASEVYIFYWDDKTSTLPYGADSFIYGRPPRTETGKHIKSVLKIINSIESEVQAHGTQHQLQRRA